MTDDDDDDGRVSAMTMMVCDDRFGAMVSDRCDDDGATMYDDVDDAVQVCGCDNDDDSATTTMMTTMCDVRCQVSMRVGVAGDNDDGMCRCGTIGAMMIVVR